MATYKIWLVDHNGFGTKFDGRRANEGLESPGDNDTLEATDEESALEEFEQMARELRALDSDWADADFALSRDDGRGWGSVVARDYSK